jgi:hypothetical protein
MPYFARKLTGWEIGPFEKDGIWSGGEMRGGQEPSVTEILGFVLSASKRLKSLA